ncbi:hypothetical protein [uncultured Salinicola sp.]|uniref:hypothetical protein n=1 Tax=uncultured Salinicola sp. TaxID=1193542 RepID=UPI0026332E1D|nr:hypothetical protein [uncultured Salinicola sp.]|tara:strand:+ start:152 stop:763 length:612 start_codon:yes stop_codon:yes gene_type:complete
MTGTIPKSLLRRPLRIGAVARAYLFAAASLDHDATNIHGSITADIVQRLGLLADEAFAVLPLTLKRSRTDPDAGSFEAELRIVDGARPYNGPVIRATSSPFDGIRLGDFSLTVMKDRFPETALAALKRRSSEEGITVGDVITTGMPLIDGLRLVSFADDQPFEAIAIPADNTTFRLEPDDVLIEDFVPDLVRRTDPRAYGSTP